MVVESSQATVSVSVVVPVIVVIWVFLGRTFVVSLMYCPTWNVPVTSDAAIVIVVLVPVTPAIVAL